MITRIKLSQRLCKKKNIQTKKGLAMRIMQVGANHVTMPIQLAYIIKSIASVERDIKILP